MQDTALDNRKSVKTLPSAPRAPNGCANVRPAFPPATRALVRHGATTNLPG